MKRIGIFTSLILGLTLTSFRQPPDIVLNSDSLSALVFKVKYNSYGMMGFGGKLKIRNTETNELFESYSKKGFNSFVIVENLPAGVYIVEEMKIISGSNVLTIRDKSKFNTVKLDGSKIYYLGSYMTKKIPPMMQLNFQVTKSENDDEEKIYKKLKKKSVNWLNHKIDFKQSLFKTETTNIEIKNY